jgi:hypothetical protein
VVGAQLRAPCARARRVDRLPPRFGADIAARPFQHGLLGAARVRAVGLGR